MSEPIEGKEIEMKVRVFDSMTSKGLEKKVNRFLEESNVEIIEIKFAGGFGFVAAMISYK